MSQTLPQTKVSLPFPENRFDRRAFLGLGFIGALGLVFAQTLAALLRFLKPIQTSGFGGKVYAGRVDEFSAGSVNHVLSGRFYLVRRDDGFLAIYQKCTHLGCAVPWVEGEGQFHCPCHGSLFNTEGEVTGGPAPRPLDTFPVSVSNGEVWVDTGQPVQRTKFDPSQVTGG